MASLSLPSQDLNIDIPDVGEVFVDPNDPFLSSAFIRTPEGFATINFQAIGEQKGFKGDEAILQGRNAFLGQIGIDPEAQFKNIRNTKSVTGTSGITIKTRNLADFHQGLFTQFGVGPDTLSKVQKQYGSDIQGFIGAIQSTPKGGGNITREVSPINPQGVVVSVDGKEVRSSPSIEQTLQAGGASVQQAKQLAGVAQAGQPFTPQQLAGAGYQTPQSQVTGPGQQFKTVTDPLTGKVSSAITGSPQVGQQGQMTPQQIQQGIDTAKTKAGEIQTGIDRLKAQGVNGTPSGQALANTFNQKASDVIRNMEATLASSLLKEEQDVTKIEDKIESILKGRKGPTQLLKEEFERRGITAQQNILKEFDKRIKAMNKEIRDIPENLQKTLEDVGVTQAQLNRLSMRDTQKSMRVLTDFMEERNAFADEVNEAVGFAQQFVGSVLEDQANHLALLEWQLNREEADVAELKAEQKELTRQALADRKEIMQLALEAIKAGSGDKVDEIMETASLEDAIKIMSGIPIESKIRTQVIDTGDSKQLINLDTGEVIKTFAQTGGSGVTINLSSANQGALLGTGFTASEVKQIESDVNQYGIEAVLAGLENEETKKTNKSPHGQKEKVTREQVASTVTLKMAQEALKDTFTPDELFKKAQKKGYAKWWSGKESDIERFLNSEDAKNLYID